MRSSIMLMSAFMSMSQQSFEVEQIHKFSDNVDMFLRMPNIIMKEIFKYIYTCTGITIFVDDE